MRRLLRWTVLLCFLVASLSFGVFGVASHQSVGPHLEALHLSDCHLPCWIGVTPGQTRIEEARAQILTYFPHDLPETNLLSRTAWSVRVRESDFTVYLIAQPDTDGHSLDPDPVIDAIVLEPAQPGGRDDSLTVAAAINLLGDPKAIGVSSTYDQSYLFTVLYFDGVAMNISTDHVMGCGPLSPESPIRTLLISAEGPEPGPSQPWRGFRSCYREQNENDSVLARK